MIPYFNVIIITVLSTIIGLVLGMILFSPDKHDFEEDFEMGCTKSRHLFPPTTNTQSIYCFCGNEVLNYELDHNIVIIKS